MRYLTRIFAALLIAYLSLNSTDLIGQSTCVSAQDFNIIGGERRSITFTVSGVENDDLSLVTQGIQSIRLDFTHTKVGDVEIFLTSPSGQMIQIVGPLIPGSIETDLVFGWDLTFIDCDETPLPDPEFPTALQYSNELEWEGLASYSGSYHPYQGCFGDIDFGPVNGIWTLDIVDDDIFDSGMINTFELKFIDQVGLNFQICEADAGNFLTPLRMTVCDFKNGLQDDLVLDFQTDNFTRADENFRYEFIIADFLSGDIIDVIEEPNLRGIFPEGNMLAVDYTICPISYSIEDSVALFAELEGSDLNSARQFLNQTASPVCADIAMNCLALEVIPILNTLRLDTTICENGEFVLFDGTGEAQVYDRPGEFIRKIGVELCDSLIILNITQSQVQAIISTDTDTIINCATDTITLGSSRSLTSSAPLRIWTTGVGEIIGDPTAAQIRVTKPGMYNLEIFNDQGCSDNMTIEIGENFDVPEITLSVQDTITCENSSTELSLITQETLFNVLWEGPDFSSSNLSPVVTKGGMYSFSAEYSNGCIYLDSIEVIENFSVPNFTVNVVPIDCKAQIMFEDSTVVPSGAQWITPSGIELSGLSPIVTEQGSYSLVAISNNGCVDTIPVNIEFTPPVENIDLTGGVLTCKDSTTNISIVGNEDYELILWEGPQIFADDRSIEVESLGIYTVRTIDEENCPGLGDFEVLRDSIPPIITIDGRNFGCTEDQLLLSVSSIEDVSNAMWSGPNGTSTGSQFTITSTGQYIASIEGQNGCIAMDTFFVAREEPFDVSIQDNIFDCNLEPIDLISTISLIQADISWIGPNGFTSMDRDIQIVDTGLYILSVTSPDQCVVIDSSFVDIKKPDFSISDLEDLTINCNQDSVQLNPQVTGAFSSAVWSSETMDIFPLLNPFVSKAGRYQLEVEDEFACRADTFLIVNVDTLMPVVNINQTGALACESQEVSLIGEIDMVVDPIILWLDENGPLDDQENIEQLITEPGEYTLRIFNPINLCVNQDQVFITEQENSLIDIELVTKSSCEDMDNGSVVISDLIGGEAPFETSLDSLDFQMSDLYDNLSADNYRVFVKDANGCVLGKDFTIGADAAIEIDLGDDIEKFAGDIIEIAIDTTGLNVSNIDWFSDDEAVSNDTDTLRFTGTDDTNIRIELMTANGCVALDELDVIIQSRQSQIYEPNSLLVGEGLNGVFRVYTNAGVERINQFYIYDRWGNEMYGIENILPEDNFGWDGRLNGDFAEQGVYGYFTKITLDSGEIEILKGTLTLFWR